MGAFLSGKTVSALVNRWYSLQPDQKANCSEQAAHCTFHAQRLGGITVQSIYHLHKRLCAEKRHAGFNMADMCSPHISHRSQPLLRQVFSLRGQISKSRFAAHLSRTRRQKRTILPRRTLPCFTAAPTAPSRQSGSSRTGSARPAAGGTAHCSAHCAPRSGNPPAAGGCRGCRIHSCRRA